MRPSLLVLLTASIASAQGGLPCDPSLVIDVEPEVGAWVSSPVDASVRFHGIDPSILAPGTFRVVVDGQDLTVPFLEYLARHASDRTRVAVAPGELLVRFPLPLPPGMRTLSFEVGNVFGHVHRGRTRLDVAPPPPPLDRPSGPMQHGDQTPPTIACDPDQNAFVKTATPTITVSYADAGLGVNPATFRAVLDGRDVTAGFTVTPAGATWPVPPGAPLPNGRRSLALSVADHPGNVATRNLTFIVFDMAVRHRWPYDPGNVPGPVGLNNVNYQNYGTSPYFHHGQDNRAPAGTRARSCTAGIVTDLVFYNNPPYYFRVEVTDPDGFVWQYHHIEEPTVPQAVREAFRNRTPIPVGTDLGAVIVWPVTDQYGMRYDHTHMNILDPDGRNLCPANFLIPSADTTPPRLLGIYVVPQGGTLSFNNTNQQNAQIRGDVDIVVRADDLIDGAPYHLGIYRFEYSVTELTGSQSHHIPPTLFYEFNDLPGGTRYPLVHDVHMPQITYDGTTRTTRGDYSAREFYYVLTNRAPNGGPVSASWFWDTDGLDAQGRRLFPDGTYRIDVEVRDHVENRTAGSLLVQIRN